MTAQLTPVWTPGDVLRKARETAQLSQAQLAEALGVDVTTVRRAEWSDRVPKRERLVAWAEATRIDVRWFQWNFDVYCAAGMPPQDQNPGLWYTPRDSNPEPADYALAA